MVEIHLAPEAFSAYQITTPLMSEYYWSEHRHSYVEHAIRSSARAITIKLLEAGMNTGKLIEDMDGHYATLETGLVVIVPQYVADLKQQLLKINPLRSSI